MNRAKDKHIIFMRAKNQSLLPPYDIKNASKVLLFYKAFIVVVMLSMLAIGGIILILSATSVKARGAYSFPCIAQEREAERNPLNLTPVNTGVGKPRLPCALFYCYWR
jgi:hypothetical protein